MTNPTDLKTLKDLRHYASASGYMYLEEDLKKEVVKWVKEIRACEFQLEEQELTGSKAQFYLDVKKRLLELNMINFFNITEEDLK